MVAGSEDAALIQFARIPEPDPGGSKQFVDWYQVKLFIEHGSGASMDALHVLLSVCAQLAAAAFCRTSVGRWVPWLFDLAIEAAKER